MSREQDTHGTFIGLTSYCFCKNVGATPTESTIILASLTNMRVQPDWVLAIFSVGAFANMLRHVPFYRNEVLYMRVHILYMDIPYFA